VAIDMSRVHLAGLSNGGLGVSHTAASEHSRRFRSLIFLSPICDTRALESYVFEDHWRAKPALIITGEADDRVPIQHVKECAESMRKAGVAVKLSTYPSVNHFLVFSHRDQCMKEISEWLKDK
jgi:predicted esterase